MAKIMVADLPARGSGMDAAGTLTGSKAGSGQSVHRRIAH